jgi:hypothetical protein
MALEEFAAGAYALSYKKPGGGSLALGLTEDGFELQFTPRGQNIEESAEFGNALIDGVDRGHIASMVVKLLSYQRVVTAQSYWMRNTAGSPLLLTNSTNPVGRLYSSMAGVMVAVGVANTPAAAVDAAIGAAGQSVFGATSTLTAGLALLAPGQAMAFQQTSKLRTVPLAFVLLPYSDGVGNTVDGVAS